METCECEGGAAGCSGVGKGVRADRIAGCADPEGVRECVAPVQGGVHGDGEVDGVPVAINGGNPELSRAGAIDVDGVPPQSGLWRVPACMGDLSGVAGMALRPDVQGGKGLVAIGAVHHGDFHHELIENLSLQRWGDG